MRASVPVVILVLALVGCGKGGSKGGADNLKTVDGPVPQEEARAVIGSRVCDAYEACRCGELAGVSLVGCEAGLGFSWQAREEDAMERGLTYDPDCAAARINAMAERGCELPDRQGLPYCSGETCQVWYGTLAEGEECEGGLSSSDCAQGLVCLGTCQPPCANSGVDIAVGEVCRDDELGFYGLCADGLVCDNTTGLCASYPEAGEPCLQGAVCAEGLWCDGFSGEAMCATLVSVGGDCVAPQQCESYSCIEGKCAPPPGEGEACTIRCADGLVCAYDGVSMAICTRPPGIGAACLQNSVTPCADGLTCQDGNCVEKPGNNESCNPGADGIPLTCKDGLICGLKLCRVTPTAPGCNACMGDESCTVYVCGEIPPAVCGDSGGLLY